MIVNYETAHYAIVNGCDPTVYSCEVAPVISGRVGFLIVGALVLAVRLWS